ncbi:unnamed protein product [Brassica napus]|uniref:(rape) hypothetical protein n=1 Tax=Brassica napus TaxID=3708 RepID=A0A816IAD1_BRANA|nr:unnamed protein product [Brassica napus]
MIGLEISTDVRGFSLFTLPPQVRFEMMLNFCRDEFWDLYKNCFHQRVYVSSKATTSSKG